MAMVLACLYILKFCGVLMTSDRALATQVVALASRCSIVSGYIPLRTAAFPVFMFSVTFFISSFSVGNVKLSSVSAQ